MILKLLLLVFINTNGQNFVVNTETTTFGDFSLGKAFNIGQLETTNNHMFLENDITYDLVPMTASKMNCALIQKASDIATSFHFDGKLGIKYGFFKADGYAKYDEATESMQRRMYVTCMVDRSLFTVSMNAPVPGSEPDLRNQIAAKQDDPDTFRKDYGMHFVNSITYGRRYLVSVGITYSQQKDYEKLAGGLKTQARFGALTISAEMNFEKEKEGSDSSFEMNIRTNTFGFLETETLQFPSNAADKAAAGDQMMAAISKNIAALQSLDGASIETCSDCTKKGILNRLSGAFPISYTISPLKDYYSVLTFDEADIDRLKSNINEAYSIEQDCIDMIEDVKVRSDMMYRSYNLLSGESDLSKIFLQTRKDLMDEITKSLFQVQDYLKLKPEEILDQNVYVWSQRSCPEDAVCLDFFTVDDTRTKVEALMGLSDADMDDKFAVGDICVFHGIHANVVQEDGSSTTMKFAGSVVYADTTVHHVMFNEKGETISLGYIKQSGADDELVFVKKDCTLIKAGSKIWYKGEGKYVIDKIGGHSYVANGRAEKKKLSDVRVYIKPQSTSKDMVMMLTLDEMEHVTLQGAENSHEFSFDTDNRLMYEDAYVLDTGFGMNEARTICSTLGHSFVAEFETQVKLPVANAWGMPFVKMDEFNCPRFASWGEACKEGGNCCTAKQTDITVTPDSTGVRLECGDYGKEEVQHECLVELWDGHNLEFLTKECASDGFGDFGIDDTCNGGKKSDDEINSARITGKNCCAVMYDESDNVVCALEPGQYSEKWDTLCGDKTVTSFTAMARGNVNEATGELTGKYVISGEVTGPLIPDKDIVLKNVIETPGNPAESIAISGKTFKFAQHMTCGSQYKIEVIKSPKGYTCTITNGEGYVSGPVSIGVSCVNDLYFTNNVGHCTSGQWIPSQGDCNKAAAELMHDDIEATVVNDATKPHGCYYKKSAADKTTGLHYNTAQAAVMDSAGTDEVSICYKAYPYYKADIGHCSTRLDGIRTVGDCNLAAKALGMVDSIATEKASTDLPFGCFYHNDGVAGEQLWFNPSPQTKLITDKQRVSICSRHSPEYHSDVGHCDDPDDFLTSIVDCDRAAGRLGFTGVTAITVDKADKPYGCSYSEGEENKLFFNTSPAANQKNTDTVRTSICVEDNLKQCPFLSHNGMQNVLECMDGSMCDVTVDLAGWDCCVLKGGRAKCPANKPKMCAKRSCGTGNYCCETDCSGDKGGLRTCENCAFLTSTRSDRLLECNDGTICDIILQGDHCCTSHEGRKRCPKGKTMCANQAVIGGSNDFRCEANCDSHGKPRQCSESKTCYRTQRTGKFIAGYAAGASPCNHAGSTCTFEEAVAECDRLNDACTGITADKEGKNVSVRQGSELIYSSNQEISWVKDDCGGSCVRFDNIQDNFCPIFGLSSGTELECQSSCMTDIRCAGYHYKPSTSQCKLVKKCASGSLEAMKISEGDWDYVSKTCFEGAFTYKKLEDLCSKSSCEAISTQEECLVASASLKLGISKIAAVHDPTDERPPGCFVYDGRQIEFNPKMDADRDLIDTDSLCKCSGIAA